MNLQNLIHQQFGMLVGELVHTAQQERLVASQRHHVGITSVIW